MPQLMFTDDDHETVARVLSALDPKPQWVRQQVEASSRPR